MAARNTEMALDNTDSPVKQQKHHVNTAAFLRAYQLSTSLWPFPVAPLPFSIRPPDFFNTRPN